MRRLHRASVVGASAAALLLGFASSASAGITNTSSVEGGYAIFQDYGDKFVVCDTALDGWSVYVTYTYIRKDGTEQRGTHYNTAGNDTCRTFDHDFGEGRTVNFRACLDWWLPDLCDDWRTGVA